MIAWLNKSGMVGEVSRADDSIVEVVATLDPTETEDAKEYKEKEDGESRGCHNFIIRDAILRLLFAFKGWKEKAVCSLAC